MKTILGNNAKKLLSRNAYVELGLGIRGKMSEGDKSSNLIEESFNELLEEKQRSGKKRFEISNFEIQQRVYRKIEENPQLNFRFGSRLYWDILSFIHSLSRTDAIENPAYPDTYLTMSADSEDIERSFHIKLGKSREDPEHFIKFHRKEKSVRQIPPNPFTEKAWKRLNPAALDGYPDYWNYIIKVGIIGNEGMCRSSVVDYFRLFDFAEVPRTDAPAFRYGVSFKELEDNLLRIHVVDVMTDDIEESIKLVSGCLLLIIFIQKQIGNRKEFIKQLQKISKRHAHMSVVFVINSLQTKEDLASDDIGDFRKKWFVDADCSALDKTESEMLRSILAKALVHSFSQAWTFKLEEMRNIKEKIVVLEEE